MLSILYIGRGELIKHLSISPLHLLHDIQTAVHNKLVHVPRGLRKSSDTIAALFGGAEFVLEERVILRANYGKVV